MKILIVTATLLAAFGFLSAQETSEVKEQDPFAEGPAAEQKRVPVRLTFRGGTEIMIDDGRLVQVDPKEIKFSCDILRPFEDSDGIDPKAMNFYDQPKTMWQVDDGFFGSFDRGRLGRALFHFSKDGSRRELILGERVDDLIKVGENEVFAAGRLERLDLGTGSLLLIQRGKDGVWNAKVIAGFFDGMARIVGRISGRNSVVISTWRSIPADHLTPPAPPDHEPRSNVGSYFEVRKDGWMRYLGESVPVARVPHSETQTSQQDALSQ